MARGAAAIETQDPWEGGDLHDGGLSSLLGFHLRMASVALYRDFVSAMEGVDLTQRQVATLFLIAANPGTPQVAIAQHLGADRATIMAMVDRLEMRGLITRERSKADRRRQELFVTKLGEKTLATVKTRIAEHEKRFTARLTPAEVEVLTNLLRRVNGQSYA